MASRTDSELIHDFKKGEVSAFNELVRRYQQKVYWIARRLLGSHEDADDAVQDVFIKVHESLRGFGAESSFFTWLYRIAVNVSLNALRKRRVLSLFGSEEVPEVAADDDPVERISRDEYSAALQKAISRLPAKQKAVFVLRYYDEMPYAEISKILRTSVGGLKANYFHALKKLKTAVKKDLEE